MPIYSLEGTPGSGKTLYCVQKIIPDFLRMRDTSGDLVPRHIYTNIEGLKPWLICAWLGIPYEAIAEYFHVLGRAIDEKGNVYEDKDLVRYWFFKPESIRWETRLNGNKQPERVPNWDEAEQIERGSLVIIDEIQNYYGARDFATTYSKMVIDYITKNRHYGWTLWWMSQSVDSVDVTFRRNTECVHFLERKENYGSSNSASVKKYEGWLAGSKTSVAPFWTGSFKYDSKYFAAYSSYVAGVKSEKRYKTNVFLGHKGFVIMAVLLALCIVAIIFNNPITKIKESAGGGQEQATKKSEQAARPAKQSFSVLAGRKAQQEDEKSEDCAVNYYVVRNETHAILKSGRDVKVRVGDVYEDCH